MRVRTLVICGLLASGACARADGPATALEPAALGRLAAMLEVCATADAERSALYVRYRNELIAVGEGTEHAMRAPGTDTPAFREAHAAVLEATAQRSREELVGQCRQGFAADASAGF